MKRERDWMDFGADVALALVGLLIAYCVGLTLLALVTTGTPFWGPY